jgi:hypothetical protein
MQRECAHRSLICNTIHSSQACGPASQSLAASVVLAEDIPVLRVLEARVCSGDPFSLHARGYRLDTVEDNEAMTSALHLPNARGALCMDCVACAAWLEMRLPGDPAFSVWDPAFFLWVQPGLNLHRNRS